MSSRQFVLLKTKLVIMELYSAAVNPLLTIYVSQRNNLNIFYEQI
jgi:hypothetical protein